MFPDNIGAMPREKQESKPPQKRPRTRRRVPETRSIGARIREERRRAGLNGVQLAEKAQVDAGALSYIERGERKPDIDTLVRICKALGISADRLLGLKTGIVAGDPSAEVLAALADIKAELAKRARDDDEA